MAHVVFAGGGTAGHLRPGLAVAEELKQVLPSATISFHGSGADWERELVTRLGFAYRAIRCRPTPRRLGDLPRFVRHNWSGYRHATRVLRALDVAAVVGLGGYVSAPSARAAVASAIPLLLLEQNAVAGKVTRWLARRAEVVCTAFERTERLPPAFCHIRHTGNPVLTAFDERRRAASDDSRRRLLILGGSQGARSLNRHVPGVLAAMRERFANWKIVHQTGPSDCDSTASTYATLGLPAETIAFIDDMPDVLAGTRLAICRSGGTTLAELAAAGVPCVAIPYPHAADDHQRANALALEARGACRLVGSLEDPALLRSVLEEVLASPRGIDDMARNMVAAGMPSAAKTVAAILCEVAGRGN